MPVALAAERAEKRAREEADRAKDAYERDDGLQQRTADVYSALAAADWCGTLGGRSSRYRRGSTRGEAGGVGRII